MGKVGLIKRLFNFIHSIISSGYLDLYFTAKIVCRQVVDRCEWILGKL